MKTRFKHLSKSTISVLLALMMVVSTVTVGIITTTAAFVEPDDSVGASVDTDDVVGTTGNEKLYIGQGDTSLTYQGTINTTPQEYTLKKNDNWINICWDNSSAWNNSYVWYDNSTNKPKWDISGATGINSISIAQNGGCYYIYVSVKAESKYNFSVTGTSASDLTLVITGGIDPICSGLSISASKNTLASETDTFTLTATATSLAATPVTYNIYRTGTATPIATFSNTSNTSVTTAALTQSDATTATYYATVEKSGYDTVTSGNETVTNSYAVVTQDIYLYGTSFGTDNWNGNLSLLTKMNYDRSSTNYYLSYTVVSDDKFRIYNASDSSDENHRQPNSNSSVELPADGTLISTKKGWGYTNWFTFPSSTVGKTIKIWYNASTYQVWIEVQKKVATSVALTIAPEKVKLGNKVRSMTATVTGVDSSLTAMHNITYTFKKADNTVIQTVTKKATETTCTIFDIPTGAGTNFTTMTTYPITVEVSTTETYTDGSETKSYLPVSDTKNLEVNNGNVYYTSDGAGDSPTWTVLTNGALNTITANVSTLAAGSSFTFALSSENDYVDAFPSFNISQEDNRYCRVTQGTKRINKEVNGEDVGFTVFTYTVTPLTGIKANSTKLYIDLSVVGGKAVNKIYAKADFDKTTGSTSTFAHTSETVKYYFAKMKSQNKDGQIDNRYDGTMWVHYWNNSVETTDGSGDDRNHGYAQGSPVKQDGTTVGTASTATDETSNGTQIYLDASQLVYDNNGPKQNTNGFTGVNDDIFDVYEFDLPVWATSVAVRGSGSPDYDVDTAKLITINPNRIYCFFKADNAIRFSGVPLDKKFWLPMSDSSRSSDTYKNEAGEKTFKANVAKLEKASSANKYWYKINEQLHNAYSGKTTTGLYFGNFYEHTQAHWNEWDTWNNFNYTANIAMRWNDDSTNKADDYKYKGGCPYYAAIWDLVGMHLKPVTTTSGGVTTTTYQLQNYDESSTVPYFDYTWLSGSTNRAKRVFKDKDFPFVQSEFDGVTTFSYDSQVDPNRAVTNNNSGDAAKENFVNTHSYKKLGSMLGYAPFTKYDNDGDNLGFVNEFNIEFYLTNTGSLKTDSGSTQDIQFNFSGDDDVWVFVDGVLVLDLGGDHMPSAGSINFTDQKVYYKSAADSITNYPASQKFYGAADKNDFSTGTSNVKTLDLAMILNAGSLTGEDFNFKDGATKHTLQMFYMERGENESNCSLSFNLPQASGLNVYSEVTANNVNPGLKAAAMLSANTDAFRYNVSVKQANDTEWSNVSGTYSLISSRKNPAAVSTLDALPQYPSIFDAWRNFTQSFTYNGTPTTTTMKGMLSSSSSSGAADSAVFSSIPTTYTTLSGQTYELSDNYVDTTSHDAIAGKTTSAEAAGYVPGDFNLLTGQKATFNNKVPANMMVKLYQDKDLDGADFTGENVLINNHSVAMNEVYDYYTTTYDIYDNQLQYYVKDATDGTSTVDIYANDQSANTDAFYFTNYSSDSNVTNPAMTVSYYNDINVGNIKIQKVVGSDVNATSEVEFSYKVYFRDIFGFDEEAAAYSAYRTYNEYPIVYHRYTTVDNAPVFGTTDDPDPAIPYDPVKGIRLRAGEYAIIEGVPVETEYKVVEGTTLGYSLSMIKKWAKYPGYEHSNTGDILYKSRNAYDSEFVNKEIYYERILFDTNEFLVTPEGYQTWDASYSTANSTIDFAHEIPNGMINGSTGAMLKDEYHVNSIPIRTQTNVEGSGGEDEYISTSWIQFTNQREGIQISFNYYPRLVVNGQPATISSAPDTYTYTIEDLYEKDGSGNYKYVTMSGEEITAVNFAAMISTAMYKFTTYNGGVFKNVIDDYQFFTSQSQAENAFEVNGGTLTNPAVSTATNYREYTAENIKYHTDYISQPNTTTSNKSDMWVSYFKDRKNLTNENYVDVEGLFGTAADAAAKATVTKINLWLYNYPKKYQVRYAEAAVSDTTANFNHTDTYNSYYVGNHLNASTYYFYYNQRFGGKALNPDGSDPHEQLYFLGPNEYGFESYTNQDVHTAGEVTLTDSGNTALKFLYWSFDPYGYSKASDDIRYYYRVSSSFTLYPVYGTEEQYNAFKGNPGLSVSLNGEDSFFDVSGNARRRVNVLMSPYNCPDNDTNIYSTAVIYVTLGDDVKTACTVAGVLDEKKVNEFYQAYKAQLPSMINGNRVGGTLTPFAYQGLTNVTLTTKGFKYDVNPDYGSYNPVDLTNKNRVQFSTRFTVSPASGEATGLTDCFAIAAAMLYHNEDSSNNSWIVSDNTVVYDFGASLS